MQSNTLTSSGAKSATLNYPSAVTSGNLLVAVVRLGNRAAVASVADNNANAWQLVDRRAETGSGNGDDLELWYAPNASAAPHARPTLTIASSMSASIRAIVVEYSGIVPVAPLDQHATSIGSSTSPLAVTSGVTSQVNELVLGYAEVENSSSFAPGTGYVLDAAVPASPNSKLALEHAVASTTGVQSAGFTITSQAWAVGVAAFR